MGDPKKQRKKYVTPGHPWEGERIKAEKTLMKEYGLKNKKELWKMSSLLKKIKTQAKSLIRREGEEDAKKEKELFLNRLAKKGIIQSAEAKLEDILGLDVRAILERRLQTIFYRKRQAKSAKQARQFIIHGHTNVGKRKVDIPSYIVPVEEENSVSFSSLSALDDPEHPERATQKKEKQKPKTEAQKDLEETKQAAEVEEKLEEAAEEIAGEEKLEKETGAKEAAEEAETKKELKKGGKQ